MAKKVKQWWEKTPKGRKIELGIVKIDRKGSTDEWASLSEKEIKKRNLEYHNAVEEIAQKFNAAQPFNWQGDGLMMFVCDQEEVALVRACSLAKAIRKTLCVDMNLDLRIAVHWGAITWHRNTGKLRDKSLDLCGHLEHVSPVNAVAVSEDVYLALPENEKKEFAPLGITKRDRFPAFVYPKTAAKNIDRSNFYANKDLEIWEAFRQYCLSPEIRKLRYVGFRLKKKEPPALDLLDVFVPLEVTRLDRRIDPYIHKDLKKELIDDDMQTARQEIPFSRYFERGETIESIPFAKLPSDKKSLMLLGDPGSGKTTLMRWLSIIASGGRYSLYKNLDVAERLLPMPVSIGQLAKIRRELGVGASVLDAMARYFHSRNVGNFKKLSAFIKRTLENNECLLLLDGLDEVKAEERNDVRAWLESFVSQYPNNRFVITSRHVGYTGFELPIDGAEFAVRPFNDEQVSKYVKAFSKAYVLWETGSDDTKLAQQEADKLLAAIHNSPRLNSLARNPFILSGMALIQRSEGRLPRHRVQFYEIFAQALCETWNTARCLVPGMEHCDISFEEEAIPVLGELALKMHEKYPTGIAPDAFVRQTLADTLIKLGYASKKESKQSVKKFLERTGKDTQLFIERGPEDWGFLHLTFQEFFVAAGLHNNEMFEQQAFKNLFSPRWEEVIRLGVGYMALIQKRRKATTDFVKKILDFKWDKAPWVTADLRLQIPLAALVACEAGEVLHQDLLAEIAQKFADWHIQFQSNLSHRILQEIALTDYTGYIAESFIRLLKSKNNENRKISADALGNIKAEKAVNPLIKALKDKNSAVRKNAVYALGQIKTDKAVNRLIEALKDKEPGIRSWAAFALGNIKAEKAINPLIKALKDKNPEVYEMALYALAQIKAEKAINPLIKALKDKNAAVRENAAYALGQVKSEKVINPLIEALKDKNLGVRLHAAYALSKNKSEKVINFLIEALKDKNPAVRVGAATALGVMEAEKAINPLIEALKDKNSRVRESAAFALADIKTEKAINPLIEALKDKSSVVRESAAFAFYVMEAEKAINPLIEALKDKNAAVRVGAATALGVMEAEKAINPLIEALKDKNAAVRKNVAEALGQIKAEKAINPLIEALKDKNSTVRSSAAYALSRIKTYKAINPLIEALKDKSSGVRESAAFVLGRTKAETAVKPLITALKDEDSDVRAGAANALLNFII